MLLTEERAADLCDGMGLGALLDAPWTNVHPPTQFDVGRGESIVMRCRCRTRANDDSENVTVRAVASIQLTMMETTRNYYLYIGQCQRCRRVYWTSSRNHSMLGEPIK